MSDLDLIIGVHSVAAALKNPKRNIKKLVATEEGRDELRKKCDFSKVDVQLVSSHKLQEEAKKSLQAMGLDYQRAPSGVFLLAEKLPDREVKELYDLVLEAPRRILCLDQITDVHNGAAILRTASFYGVDTVVLPGKKSFGATPTYFRIASGAHEFLNLFKVNNLSKTLSKLKELNTLAIGLSERADQELKGALVKKHSGSVALVLGKEETGISHAVMRVLDHQMSIKSQGVIQSLNVSVAAAISMEKCFGIS
ncbi:MAG: RNA methyltransferase [Bacteriovoracaceae bacterium]